MELILSNENGSSARRFILSAVFWLVVGSTLGVILAIKMSYPDFLGGVDFLSFGRMRPTHIAGQAFGWLSMAQIGIAYYVTAKLCRRPLWNERLGNLTMWAWNLVVLLGAVTLLMGMSQGREYAEMIWILDVGVMVGLVLAGLNVFMTVLLRQERQLYASLWYIMGSFIWMPMVYFIGNVMWITPFTATTQAPFAGAIAGVNDANINWFYGHNILGLWFTTLGVGSVYYLLPVITRNPLYSHRLSLIGFWTIGFFYIWTGAHHLVWGPVPYWLQTVAIMFSILLILPVSTVVVNFLGTMRGKWHLLVTNLPIRFFVSGTVFYLITCLQGPSQSLRTVSQAVKFTNWVPGHAHLAVFGTFTFIAMGAIYYVLPRRVGRKEMARPSLMEWQFWFALVGFFGFAISLWIGGLVQGAMWTQGVPFLESVRAQAPYYMIRLISGVLMLISVLLFAYNVYITWQNKPEAVDAGQPQPAAAAM